MALPFVDPNEVLSELPLKKDMVVADFGCGSGGWVIPLARRLEDGVVYAIDVQEAPLSALMSKVNLQGLANIKKVLTDVEKGVPSISDDLCDLVLMTNLLFQIEDKKAVLKEAQRVLKHNGKLLVVEWDENAKFGSQEGKLSKELAKQIIQEIGFVLEKEIETGGYHYGLLFAKP